MADESRANARADDSVDDGPPTVVEDLVSVVRDGVIGAAAGFAGMVAMSVFLLVAATAGAFDVASIAELGVILGFGESLLVGYAVLLGGGMTAWPLLFAAIGERLPGKSTPLRGVSFATVMWSGFVFAFYSGESGLALALYVVLTLLAHWTYGFVLGVAFDFFSERVPDITLDNAPIA